MRPHGHRALKRRSPHLAGWRGHSQVELWRCRVNIGRIEGVLDHLTDTLGSTLMGETMVAEEQELLFFPDTSALSNMSRPSEASKEVEYFLDNYSSCKQSWGQGWMGWEVRWGRQSYRQSLQIATSPLACKGAEEEGADLERRSFHWACGPRPSSCTSPGSVHPR